MNDRSQELRTARIVVLNDDPLEGRQIVTLLETADYEVSLAQDLFRLDALLGESPVDLIIADGVQALSGAAQTIERIKADSVIQQIYITPRDSAVDRSLRRIVSTGSILVRPFAPGELTTIVRSHLDGPDTQRFVSKVDWSEQYEFGDVCIDPRNRQVLIGKVRVQLRPREFDLLAFLATRDGIVCTRETLMRKVWGLAYDFTSRTLDVHIRWLRQKVEVDPERPKRLITVRSIGYQLVQTELAGALA